MRRAMLETLGLDYRQWLALTRASIRRDFRESVMASAMGRRSSGAGAVWGLMFFYFLTGIVFAGMAVGSDDLLTTATLLITYSALMIAGLLLVEFHTVVVSPDDYATLAFRPITSRTYFLVRLTNILFYVALFTLAMTLPGVVVYASLPHLQPLRGLALLVSVFWANGVATLAIVILYAWLLKKVSGTRLQSALAYFQVGFSLLVYSGFFLLPGLMKSRMFSALLEGERFFLLPTAWFTAPLGFVLGAASEQTLLSLGLAVGLTALLGYLGFSKLSISYSERLSELVNAADRPRAARAQSLSPKWLFRSFEERAVSRLLWNQFKRDTRFRMAVLGILPVSFFYLLMGLQEGPLQDPFIEPEINLFSTGFLYFAVLLFPLMLRTFIAQSDAYEAAWIFFATPVDQRRLILAQKRFLMAFFVAPFLFILGAIFYYFFQNVWHTVLHIMVLGLLTHLALQLVFLQSPDLPFSRPNLRASRSMSLTVYVVVVPVVVYLVLPLLFRYVYPQADRLAWFCAVAVAMSVLLERLVRSRIARRLRNLEFAG